MTQLTDKIREALLGNVGTIICGRIGVTDAEQMVKAFTPTFTAEDLTKTPNFAAVAKVMMFDMPSAPFTMNLPPPMGEPNDNLMETLKVYSATKYARTRSEVEREIEERWSTMKPDPEPESESEPDVVRETPEKGFLDEWLSKNPASPVVETTKSTPTPTEPPTAPSATEVSDAPSAQPSTTAQPNETIFKVR